MILVLFYTNNPFFFLSLAKIFRLLIEIPVKCFYLTLQLNLNL